MPWGHVGNTRVTLVLSIGVETAGAIHERQVTVAPEATHRTLHSQHTLQQSTRVLLGTLRLAGENFQTMKTPIT